MVLLIEIDLSLRHGYGLVIKCILIFYYLFIVIHYFSLVASNLQGTVWHN